MNKNIHIVNTEKLARLIGLASTPKAKMILIKEWASEFRLACRFAARLSQ